MGPIKRRFVLATWLGASCVEAASSFSSYFSVTGEVGPQDALLPGASPGCSSVPHFVGNSFVRESPDYANHFGLRAACVSRYHKSFGK